MKMYLVTGLTELAHRFFVEYGFWLTLRLCVVSSQQVQLSLVTGAEAAVSNAAHLGLWQSVLQVLPTGKFPATIHAKILAPLPSATYFAPGTVRHMC